MNVKVTGDDKFMGCSCSEGEKGTEVCTSVMFAHKLSLLDVAAQLKCSAYAALGLVRNCAQFVVKHC